MAADIILNNADTEIVENVRITRTPGGDPTILLSASHGNIKLGGDGADGDLVIVDHEAKARIHIDSQHGSPTSEHVRVFIDGRHGNIKLGGDGADGDLIVVDHEAKARVHVDSQHGSPASEHVRVFIDGSHGNIKLGGDGADGDLIVADHEAKARVHVDSQHGSPTSGHVRVFIDGRSGELVLGGDQQAGALHIADVSGTRIVSADGNGRITCSELSAKKIEVGSIADLETKIRQLEPGSPSDERLKDDIRLMDESAGLIERLDAVRFKWRPEAAHGRSGEQIGLVAQQVQEILPEAVHEDESGFLRIDYDSIVAICVETMKAQQRELSHQGNRIALLEDRVGRLEDRP